jgi:hypothetical protein
VSHCARGGNADGGFTSLDAQVGWRPLPGNQEFELVLIGRNLTDSTQRNAIALNKDEVILRGRDVRLVVRARHSETCTVGTGWRRPLSLVPEDRSRGSARARGGTAAAAIRFHQQARAAA